MTFIEILKAIPSIVGLINQVINGFKLLKVAYDKYTLDLYIQDLGKTIHLLSNAKTSEEKSDAASKIADLFKRG